MPFRRSVCLIALVLAGRLPAQEPHGQGAPGLPNPFFAMDTGLRGAGLTAPQDRALCLEQLGYAGMSVGGVQGLGDLRSQLEDRGLRLFAVYLGFALEDVEGSTRTIRAAIRDVAGTDAVIWVTVTSKRFPRSDPRGDGPAAEALGPIAAEAAAAGLRVALYPHKGFWVERIEDAMRVADRVNSEHLGVTFNLCHWLSLAPSDEPVTLLRTALPRLFVVTINGAERGGSGWDRLIQTLDRGSFPVDRLLVALQSLGYRGPIGLQHYGIGGDARKNLIRSMTAWRAMNTRIAAGQVQPLSDDDVYRQIAAYEFGQSRRGFGVIRDRLKLATPAGRTQIEARLLNVLGSSDASDACKEEVCRILREWGTRESLPVLAGLLAEPRFAFAALAALQGREYAGLGEALLLAARTAPESCRAPLATALGELRLQAAVPALTQWAATGRAGSAAAAIAALGRIGDGNAVTSLLSLAVSDDLQPVWADACLSAAERSLAVGDGAQATAVYERLLSRQFPSPMRIASLRGLVTCRGTAAITLLLDHLGGADPEMQRTAARLAALVPGQEATAAFARQLPSLEPAVQLILLQALTERGDTAAKAAVADLAAADAPDDVRAVAVRALQTLGDAGDVPLLATLAAAGGEVGKTAEESLCGLATEGVDEAIARRAGAAGMDVAAVLVRVMKARGRAGSIPALLDLVGNGSGSVRQQALRALGALGDDSTIPPLCGFMETMAEEAVLTEVGKALVSVGRRTRADAHVVPHLITAFRGSAGNGRAALVSVLGEFGGTAALAAVREALADEAPPVRNAAVRALANWPDASPLDTLLDLSRNGETEPLRLMALAGTIRMIGKAVDTSPGERLSLYRSALANAGRPQERKQILGELANVLDYDVLGLIGELLQDEAVGPEARLAYLKSARSAGPLSPGAAVASLRRATEAIGDPGFAGSAKEAIAWIEQIDGHVTAWNVAGPYAAAGGDLMGTVHGPAETEAQGVGWQQVDATVGPFTQFITAGGVNLGALFSDTNAVAYLRTRVQSPERREAVIELGSDDGVRVWLNGEAVHTNDARRATHRASDKVPCVLSEGWNNLLVKVTQATGEWGLCLRFTHPNGTPMHDLRFSPR